MLLVADDKLGVISQVLLNVEAIKVRGLHLAGVILNTIDNTQNEHMNNTADLREHLDCPIFTSPYANSDEINLPEVLIDALIISSHGQNSNLRAIK